MAGEFALITGSGQGLPGTTEVAFDPGSITTDADSILSESAGVFTPQEAGQYLIIADAKFDQSHNNRVTIEATFQRNSTDYAGGIGSLYTRRNQSPVDTWHIFTIASFNGTTDSFRFRHRNDAGDGTPAGAYDWSVVKVVRLSDTTTALPFGHYGTPTANALNGANSWTDVTGWDVITETDTSVIELQAGGTNIRLKEADRPYLVVYGLKGDNSATGRTTRITELLHNNTRIHHSIGYCYQRDSDDESVHPVGMGLVRPATANQDLKIRGAGYIDNHGTFWGTFDVGSWSMVSTANAAGIAVIALPSGTDVAIFEDATGNQNISGTNNPDLNVFRTAVGTVDSPFSRINNTDVDVTSATDILMYSGILVERTASSGTRYNKGMVIEKEGVDQSSHGESIGYERGEQSSDDCKVAALTASYVGAAAANDTFQVQSFTPAEVSDTGGNNVYSWGGGFFIDLASLDAGGTQYSETGRAASFDATSDSTETADFSEPGLSALADWTPASTDVAAFNDQGLAALVDFTTDSTDSVTKVYDETGRAATVDLTVANTDIAGFLDAVAAAVDYAAALTDTTTRGDTCSALADFTVDSTDDLTYGESLSATTDLTADSSDTVDLQDNLSAETEFTVDSTDTLDTGQTSSPVQVLEDHDWGTLRSTQTGPLSLARIDGSNFTSGDKYLCLFRIAVTGSNSDSTGFYAKYKTPSGTSWSDLGRLEPLSTTYGTVYSRAIIVTATNAYDADLGIQEASSYYTRGYDASIVCINMSDLGVEDTDYFTGSYVSGTNSTAWSTRSSVTFTPTAGDDILLLGSGSISVNDITIQGEMEIAKDSTRLPDSTWMSQEGEDSVEFGYRMLVGVDRNVTATERTYQLRVRDDATGSPQNGHASTQIIAIPLSLFQKHTIDVGDDLTEEGDFTEYTYTPAASVEHAPEVTGDQIILGAWSQYSSARGRITSDGVVDPGNPYNYSYAAFDFDDRHSTPFFTLNSIDTYGEVVNLEYYCGDTTDLYNPMLVVISPRTAGPSGPNYVEAMLDAKVEFGATCNDTYTNLNPKPIEGLEDHDWGTRYTETTTTDEVLASIADTNYTNGQIYLTLFRGMLWGSSVAMNTARMNFYTPDYQYQQSLANNFEPASTTRGQIVSMFRLGAHESDNHAEISIEETGSYTTFGSDASILSINLSDFGTPGIDYWYHGPSDYGDNSTSWAVRASVTLTPQAGDDLLILANVNSQIDNVDHQCESEIAKDGTRLTDSTWNSIEGEDVATNQYYNLIGVDKNVSATERTYQLRTRDDGGVANFNNYSSPRILVIRLNSFETYAIATASDITSPTTSAWTSAVGMSYTPDTTGEQVIIGAWSQLNEGDMRLRFDDTTNDPGSQYAAALAYQDIDDRHSYMTFTMRNIDTGGEDIDYEYYTSTGGSDFYSPILVAFSLRTVGSSTSIDETGRSASFDATADSSDTVDLVDNLNALVDFTPDSADTVELADALDALVDFTADSTDVLTSGTTYDETGRTALIDLTTATSDTVDLLDTSAALVDLTTASTDELGLSDSLSAQVEVTTSQSNVASLVESVASEVELTGSSTDAQPMTASGSALVELVTDISSSLTVGESAAATVELSSALTDYGRTITEHLAVWVTWSADTTEGQTYTDSLSAQVELTTNSTDAVDFTESVAASADYTTDSNDTADLEDSVSAEVTLTAEINDIYNPSSGDITIVRSTSGNHNSSATVRVYFGSPATAPAEDNQQVIVLFTRATSVTTPTGWTKEDTVGSGDEHCVLRRTAGSSESNTYVDVTVSASDQNAWAYYELSGVDTANPVRDTATQDTTGDTTSRASGTTDTTPAIGDFAIVGFGSRADISSQSFTNASQDENDQTSGGVVAEITTGSWTLTSAGATSDTMTWTTSASTRGLIIVFKKGGTVAYNEQGREAEVTLTTDSGDTAELDDAGLSAEVQLTTDVTEGVTVTESLAATVELTTDSTGGLSYAESLSAYAEYTTQLAEAYGAAESLSAETTLTVDSGDVAALVDASAALVELTTDSTDIYSGAPGQYDETGRSALVELTTASTDTADLQDQPAALVELTTTHVDVLPVVELLAALVELTTASTEVQYALPDVGPGSGSATGTTSPASASTQAGVPSTATNVSSPPGVSTAGGTPGVGSNTGIPSVTGTSGIPSVDYDDS